MKIFHCFFGFRMGGAETLVADLANRQVEAGHDVTLLVVNTDIDPALLDTLSPSVHRKFFNRRPGSRNPLHILRLNLYMLREKPDAVHIHNIRIAGMLLPALKRGAVFTLHTTGIPLEMARGLKLAAISPTVKAEALERYPDAEITVINNSIDIDRVSRRPAAPLGDMMKIVQLGRLFPEVKGQDLLVKALGILRRKGICNITADFIGEGEGRVEIERLAAEEGVAGQVKLLGSLSRSDTYSRLGQYDLMVHPSRIEGFGLAVAEGMAACLPVVVPDKGAPCEIADNGRLAITFRYGDAQSLAEALEAIISDYSKAAALTAPARDYVCRHYSLQSMVDAYQRFYQL